MDVIPNVPLDVLASRVASCVAAVAVLARNRARTSSPSANAEVLSVVDCSRTVAAAVSPEALPPMTVVMPYARVADTNRIAIHGSSQRALLRLMCEST
jgi:hypothetical protein